MDKTNGEMQLESLQNEINPNVSWRDWIDDWPRDHGWDELWPTDSWCDWSDSHSN